LFDLAQIPWEQMISNTVCTTRERFESKEKPTRSEVRTWIVSPAYFYFDFQPGIQSPKNNFLDYKNN